MRDNIFSENNFVFVYSNYTDEVPFRQTISSICSVMVLKYRRKDLRSVEIAFHNRDIKQPWVHVFFR